MVWMDFITCGTLHLSVIPLGNAQFAGLIEEKKILAEDKEGNQLLLV